MASELSERCSQADYHNFQFNLDVQNPIEFPSTIALNVEDEFKKAQDQLVSNDAGKIDSYINPRPGVLDEEQSRVAALNHESDFIAHEWNYSFIAVIKDEKNADLDDEYDDDHQIGHLYDYKSYVDDQDRAQISIKIPHRSGKKPQLTIRKSSYAIDKVRRAQITRQRRTVINSFLKTTPVTQNGLIEMSRDAIFDKIVDFDIPKDWKVDTDKICKHVSTDGVKCTRNATFGFTQDGLSISCAEHLQPGMILRPYSKCMTDGCREVAVAGRMFNARRKAPTVCKKCYDDTIHIYYSRRHCTSCCYLTVVDGYGKCKRCSINM